MLAGLAGSPRLMGHADLTFLQRNLALVKHDLQAAHEKYGAADNMLPRRALKNPMSGKMPDQCLPQRAEVVN